MPWPHRISGSPDAPPVIFLHGFLGNGSDWLSVVKKLPVFGILPDLPGCGKNTVFPIHGLLSFDNVAGQLITLLDDLNLDQVNLVGYSMGGRIALYTGSRYPDRIKRLVIESANPGISDPEARRTRAALDARRAETILEKGIEAFVDDWYKMDLFKTLGKPYTPRKSHYRVQEMNAARKKNDPNWAAKVIREMSPGLQSPLWDSLETINIPTLLICGALDIKYTAIMQDMSTRLPDARLKIIDGAGHNTHFESPAQFVDAVENFL